MDDMLKEFEKLGEFGERPAADDLSNTMVVPRVEDIIEERPLEAVTSSEELESEMTKLNKNEKTTVLSRFTQIAKDKTSGIKKGSGGKGKGPVKNKKLRILRNILIALLIFCAVCACIGGIMVFNIVKDAPKIQTDNIYDLLSENSILYDKNGVVIDNIYSGDSLRTNLEYSELPQQLIDAFVSIEDKTFWKHNGFNYVRMIGAIVQKLRGQSERIGGTSTITQQLARNLYLADIKSQRSLNRKIIEAYYTRQLEKRLSKEQIIEAYLNTIYLGFNCNGVAAASEAYFSKEAKDLTLLECAQLAALPQSPNNYAPLKRIATVDVEDPDSLDIVSKTDDWIIYYNDTGANRINLVLYYMHDQNKITDEEYEVAKADTIRNYLNPGTSAITETTTSYFADYVKSVVLDDLVAAGYDSETASDLLYRGGLRIHSTMDVEIQNIMDAEYENPKNFPGVGSYSKDKEGNVLDSNKKILLYNYAHYFNSNNDFVLKPEEFAYQENGDLLLYGGNRLNFYRTSVQGSTDYSIEFKNLYMTDDGVFYSISGGVWNIPAEYKDRLESGDCVISHDYFEARPEAFKLQEDGTLVLDHNYFSLRQRIRQPQSAMVIMENGTGKILGMVGGRDIAGKLLYNRATSPRQPGSSIKPLGLYSLALQLGANGREGFTAAMPLDDMPIIFSRSFWPANAYKGYTGITNLRHAVEQSINACAVNLYMAIGDANLSIEQLQNMGISTLVTEGTVNDLNASALALGGMTRGVSPLEMTAAYGTFGNYGVYTEPCCYTTVTTRNGGVILQKEPEQRQVLDEAVASLMTDILRTTVTDGIAGAAKLSSQPSAGKTGTTSERYDIWFCGLTPQYSAAVWIGNDVNIALSSGSSVAARLWGTVMNQVGARVPREEFEMKGEFVTMTVDRYSGAQSELAALDPRGGTYLTEKFIKGTEPTAWTNPNVTTCGHQFATVCSVSGYLATPMCPSTYQKIGVIRPGGVSWEKLLATFESQMGYLTDEAKEKGRTSGYSLTSIPDAIYDLPEYYCPFHNPDTSAYPVSPYAAQTVPQDGATYYIDENGNIVDNTIPDWIRGNDTTVTDPNNPTPITDPKPTTETTTTPTTPTQSDPNEMPEWLRQ